MISLIRQITENACQMVLNIHRFSSDDYQLVAYGNILNYLLNIIRSSFNILSYVIR